MVAGRIAQPFDLDHGHEFDFPDTAFDQTREMIVDQKDIPDLFRPVHLGRYQLTNRIVMAPLTCGRVGRDGVRRSFPMAVHCGQRASAGLWSVGRPTPTG